MKKSLIVTLLTLIAVHAFTAPLYLVFNEPTNAVSAGATQYLAYWQVNSTTTAFGSCGVGTNYIAFDSTNVPAVCTITMVTTDGVNYSASTLSLPYNQAQFILQPPGSIRIQRNHP